MPQHFTTETHLGRTPEQIFRVFLRRYRGCPCHFPEITLEKMCLLAAGMQKLIDSGRRFYKGMLDTWFTWYRIYDPGLRIDKHVNFQHYYNWKTSREYLIFPLDRRGCVLNYERIKILADAVITLE